MINYKRLFSACWRERGLDDDDDENDDEDGDDDYDDDDGDDDYDDDGQWSFTLLQGKMAILDVEPQALKILRSAEWVSEKRSKKNNTE